MEDLRSKLVPYSSWIIIKTRAEDEVVRIIHFTPEAITLPDGAAMANMSIRDEYQSRANQMTSDAAKILSPLRLSLIEGNGPMFGTNSR